MISSIKVNESVNLIINKVMPQLTRSPYTKMWINKYAPSEINPLVVRNCRDYATPMRIDLSLFPASCLDFLNKKEQEEGKNFVTHLQFQLGTRSECSRHLLSLLTVTIIIARAKEVSSFNLQLSVSSFSACASHALTCGHLWPCISSHCLH